MHVDYTKLFDTPDDLAEFLIKSNEEQDRILAEMLPEKISLMLTCKIPGRKSSR